MRQIVLLLILVLTLTGLPIAYGWIATSHGGWEKVVVLAHLWLGLIFLVAFPLYAWDHVGTNRRWLTRFKALTVSGVFQLAAGGFLILSGVALYLYGEQVWITLRETHHWITYPLITSIIAHFVSPKRWK